MTAGELLGPAGGLPQHLGGLSLRSGSTTPGTMSWAASSQGSRHSRGPQAAGRASIATASASGDYSSGYGYDSGAVVSGDADDDTAGYCGSGGAGKGAAGRDEAERAAKASVVSRVGLHSVDDQEVGGGKVHKSVGTSNSFGLSPSSGGGQSEWGRRSGMAAGAGEEWPPDVSRG
jgi:hypothetical protein